MSFWMQACFAKLECDLDVATVLQQDDAGPQPWDKLLEEHSPKPPTSLVQEVQRSGKFTPLFWGWFHLNGIDDYLGATVGLTLEAFMNWDAKKRIASIKPVMDKLINDISKGSYDPKDLMSNPYQQLQMVRKEMYRMRNDCQFSTGLISFEDEIKLQKRIAEKADENERSLKDVVEKTFCPSFYDDAEETLNDIEDLIKEWESKVRPAIKEWLPGKRFPPRFNNLLFSGLAEESTKVKYKQKRDKLRKLFE
jgi:hypothetical protein